MTIGLGEPFAIELSLFTKLPMPNRMNRVTPLAQVELQNLKAGVLPRIVPYEDIDISLPVGSCNDRRR